MRNRASKVESPSPTTTDSVAWQSSSPPSSSLPPIRTTTASPEDWSGKGGGGEGEGEREPVSPVGRMFLQEDLQVHVVCTLGFRNRVDLKKMRELLGETLVKHPRFRSRVDFTSPHKPLWTPCEVDLHRHIQEINLEEGETERDGGRESGEEREAPLEEFVSKLGMEPFMDTSYPLWVAYVVNCREREAEGHLVFRIHHSLGDGISLMSLLLACTRQLDNPHLLPTIPGTSNPRNQKIAVKNDKIELENGENKNGVETAKNEVVKGEGSDDGNRLSLPSVRNGSSLAPSSLLSSTVLEKQKTSFFRSILKGTEFVVNTVVHYVQFLGLVLAFQDSNTKIKGGKGTEKGKFSMRVSDEISLADVSLVRRASGGATVTDVIMATVSAGLRLYMLQKDKNEDSKKVHPDKALVGSLTLVNLRSSPGLQELSTMMATGSKVRWGNDVGYFLIPLPVGKFSHPLDRVKKMRKVILKKKNSAEAAISHINGVLVTELLGSKVIADLSYRASSRTTVSTSSMVGPRERVSLGGMEVVYVAATVTGTPQSLIVHILSYNGMLRICIWASTEVIQDPSKLCRSFLTSFEEMKKSAEIALSSEK